MEMYKISSIANDLIREIICLFIQINWELRWFYLGSIAFAGSIFTILGD